MAVTRTYVLSRTDESLKELQSSEQQLTDSQLPSTVFELTNEFVLCTQFNDRYKKPQLFQLLIVRGKDVDLEKSREVVRTWQAGLKSLLQYPIDLLLAPNRPELKIVKVCMCVCLSIVFMNSIIIMCVNSSTKISLWCIFYFELFL